MSLTTVERVKAYLRLRDDQSAELDGIVETLIASVDAWFENATVRALASAARTESFVYQGREDRILPRYYPITAVSSVKVDGVTISPASSWASGSGWYLVGDAIWMLGSEVDEGCLVELAYTAGYATVPEDLAQAATELVAIKFSERKHVGSQTQNLSGYSVTWLPAIVPQTVKDVVDHYRVPVVG